MWTFSGIPWSVSRIFVYIILCVRQQVWLETGERTSGFSRMQWTSECRKLQRSVTTCVVCAGPVFCVRASVWGLPTLSTNCHETNYLTSWSFETLQVLKANYSTGWPEVYSLCLHSCPLKLRWSLVWVIKPYENRNTRCLGKWTWVYLIVYCSIPPEGGPYTPAHSRWALHGLLLGISFMSSYVLASQPTYYLASCESSWAARVGPGLHCSLPSDYSKICGTVCNRHPGMPSRTLCQ